MKRDMAVHILALIPRAPRFITAKEVADRLGVHLRTVERDLLELMRNHPISYRDGQPYGWYWLADAPCPFGKCSPLCESPVVYVAAPQVDVAEILRKAMGPRRRVRRAKPAQPEQVALFVLASGGEK